MPISIPVPDRSAGDVFTETMWDAYLKDNINKLLDRGHRVLTVAQFLALTGLEDGDEAYVEVDGANGIEWHLRYHAASTAWRFLGGPALVAEVTAQESTSSATYVALTTAGPAVVTPLVGDYDVEVATHGFNDNASGGGHMSYDIGATAAVDADSTLIGNFGVNTSAQRRKTGLARGVALTAKYRRTVAGSAFFSRRRLVVVPVTVTNA